MDLDQSDSTRGGTLLRLVGRVHEAVATVEAWLGAVYTTFFALLIGVGVMAGAIAAPIDQEFGTPWAVAMLVMAGLWLALDVPFLFSTWQCVRQRARPLAPAATRGLSPWPGLLRVVQGVWFLSHFGCAAAFAHMALTMPPPPSMQGQRPLGYVILIATLAFAYTLASNGYLLAAVKSLGGRDSWVDFAWRWRVVIDVGLVVLGPAISLATKA